MKKIVLLSVLVLIFSLPAFAEKTPFPQGFKWCVATAGFQVEGGDTTSDWAQWEKTSGHIKKGEVSGLACDEWNRFDQDVQLMKDLHVTEYRMSVEWAKVEPTEGNFDQMAITHYRNAIKSLEAAGIRPMLTLQHFTFPEWLRKKGGWEWRGTPDAFAKFTNIVYTEIGPEVEDWITVNEPAVNISGGYVTGQMPPGEKRQFSELPPIFVGMLTSHARAYHMLHELAEKSGRKVRVGIAHHLRTMDAYENWNPVDHVAASIADTVWNWAIPDAVETGRLEMHIVWMVNFSQDIPELKGTEDFLGVNYYSGDLIHFSTSEGFQIHTRDDLPKNDLGWDIYPEGFHRILMAATERYPGKSIFITENGIADATDHLRPQYIRDHLRMILQSIAEGANVEGYCHWSLMDNFEWTEGFTPRFGLYQTNYQTLARTPRTSAKLFSEIAKDNAL